MANIKRYGPTNSRPNFLSSEEGLVPKTRMIPQSMGVTDTETGRLYVQVGTIFPANDDTAEGIVYPNGPDCFAYDVTDGDVEGAVLIAGRVYENRLPVAADADAIVALEAKGLYFDTVADQVRPAWTV